MSTKRAAPTVSSLNEGDSKSVCQRKIRDIVRDDELEELLRLTQLSDTRIFEFGKWEAELGDAGLVDAELVDKALQSSWVVRDMVRRAVASAECNVEINPSSARATADGNGILLTSRVKRSADGRSSVSWWDPLNVPTADERNLAKTAAFALQFRDLTKDQESSIEQHIAHVLEQADSLAWTDEGIAQMPKSCKTQSGAWTCTSSFDKAASSRQGDSTGDTEAEALEWALELVKQEERTGSEDVNMEDVDG